MKKASQVFLVSLVSAGLTDPAYARGESLDSFKEIPHGIMQRMSHVAGAGLGEV